jgi:AraC-like DNA-binding protein
MSKILVKNMVCDRCIRSVQEQLEALGYKVVAIELGRVEVAQTLRKSDYTKISKMLSDNGFELISDTDVETIEQIKRIVLDHLHHGPKKPANVNFSTYLASELGLNYFHLSKLFSATEGMTIERYIILQKIERVKELLLYDQQNLSEIAFDLEYSSVAHLSRQFKNVSGLTPTAFKKQGSKGRKPIDKI